MSKYFEIDQRFCEMLNKAVDGYQLKIGGRISDERLNDCVNLKAIITYAIYNNGELCNSEELSVALIHYIDAIETSMFSRLINSFLITTGKNLFLLRKSIMKVIEKEKPAAILRELQNAQLTIACLHGNEIIAEDRSLRSLNIKLKDELNELKESYNDVVKSNSELVKENSHLQNEFFLMLKEQAQQYSCIEIERTKQYELINKLKDNINNLETALAAIQKTVEGQQETIASQQKTIDALNYQCRYH